MVVVCGQQHGRHLPPQRLNLGLHVVQSPEAVADARDGDEFAFDPATRASVERDAGQDVRAGAAHAQGRRDPSKRRHLRGGAPRVPRLGRAAPRSNGPTPSSRARMTTTEQIVWAHRVDKDARACARRHAAGVRRSAAGLGRHRAVRDSHVQSDHRRQHDLPRQAAIANDHFVFTGTRRRREADQHRPAVRAAARHGEAVLRDAGRRHFPLLFSRAGARPAGAVHSRRRFAQPRLWRLRRGRHRRWFDDARIRVGDGLHLLHAGEGATRARSADSCSRG